MNLYVPACGDRLTLSAPWTFPLVLESRNLKFAAAREIPGHEAWKGQWKVWEGKPFDSRMKRVDVTLPEGTVLECDRVYIRGFNKSRTLVEDDFDSITWKVMRKDKPARNQRFWAKLSDCNRIVHDPSLLSTFRDRVKLAKEIMGS